MTINTNSITIFVSIKDKNKMKPNKKVLSHRFKHFRSGLVKSMVVVPGKLEKSRENVLSLTLDSRDDYCNGAWVQPELDGVTV